MARKKLKWNAGAADAVNFGKPPVEGKKAIEKSGVLDHIMSHDGLGQRTVLFSDGAKVYPSLCEKMQVKHFACSHRSGQFCHTVKFKRKTLKVHTGTMEFGLC
ncbi:unnamed protein product [Durusdinium trenchii]|uniref:Transposase n=2 Tax=Durusdinium trenchii TaxID=1381693 RepID=A0ABP0H8S6_9DINO